MVWSQLQQGQKPVTVSEPQAGRDKLRPAIQPPGPHVNGRVLAPPPSWLKQQAAAAASATAKSQTNSGQNVSESSNPVTPQKPTTVSICQFVVVIPGKQRLCLWL